MLTYWGEVLGRGFSSGAVRCWCEGGCGNVLNWDEVAPTVILRFSAGVPEGECMGPPSFRLSSAINGPGSGVLGEASENK